MPRKPKRITTAAILTTLTLCLSSTALAHRPTFSAELAYVGQGVSKSEMLGLEPRLVLRFDPDRPLALYARIGAGKSGVVDESSADGIHGELALGLDKSVCLPDTSLCAGARAGLGLQFADYVVGPNVDTGHYRASSLFAELMPYVSWSRLTLGLETRGHADVNAVSVSPDGYENGVKEGKFHLALGLALAFRF